MKAFFAIPTLPLFLAAFPAWGASVTTVSGPWAELRNGPVFQAETQALSRNWGPALPLGREFRIEKVYGRWLYGTPEPHPKMKKAEHARPGWIFSRMLLVPGDEDTLPSSVVTQARGVIYHSRDAWKKLGIGRPSLDFLESLTLSRGTLNAFRAQDETPVSQPRFPFRFNFFVANASETSGSPPLGLSGTDLGFLDQEFQVIQKKKAEAERKRLAEKLHPPGAPALNNATRTGVLGRYMVEKYLELPPLTHEEVDGFIYMRATAMRALEGCPKEVRDYWKSRRWNHFRAFRLKSRPEVRHPWLEVAAPGGYFAFSARSIELAGNEAELAFLLVRPLVRELRIKRKSIAFKPKEWPKDLPALSEEVWDQTLKAQSTKESENLDVGDEISVDLAAMECISRAGYRPMGGLSYLRKMAAKREEPWARWYKENSIGLDYRIERAAELLKEALARNAFPEGRATNLKRFSTAARHWNLLP